MGLCWLWRFSTLNSGSLNFQVHLGFFCHNGNHSLTNSYIFVFHCFFYRSDNSATRLYVIRNEEPGEACLNQVKARYVLFTFFPRPSYRMVYYFQFSKSEDEILCCYHSNETSLAELLKVLFISMDFARRWLWNFVILREKCSIKRQNMFTWHTITLSLTIAVSPFPSKYLCDRLACEQAFGRAGIPSLSSLFFSSNREPVHRLVIA